MSLTDRILEFEKCLKKFEEALNQPKNEFIRDSSIKRFEMCFELGWKVLKDYLQYLSIFCRSPRHCLKEAYSLGLIDFEEDWLDMLDDRNLSVHTYSEELAEILYNRLPQHYQTLKNLLEKIRKDMERFG